MKSRNPIKYNRMQSIIFCIIVFYLAAGFAEEACKFSYKGKPEDLIGKTVSVPDKIVALSDFIYAQSTTSSNSAHTTPSIFFVIDNSGSMYQPQSNNGGKLPSDRWGNRYTVTSAVLDTIYKRSPNAEVGVAAFNRSLYFNPIHPTIKRFATLTTPNNGGAYVELLVLDSVYQPENLSGYKILKEILKTDTVPFIDLPSHTYLSLALPPYDDYASTNINIGFEAARQAFSTSKYLKNNQYILFFSDGEATEPNNDSKNDYVTKVTNIPTTYTVFFTSDSSGLPNLNQMTQNIQNNGYSSSNPRSHLWRYQNTSMETLLDFVMKNVILNMFENVVTYPINATINGINPVGPWSNGGFQYADLFALTGVNTTFQYQMNYRRVRDSITASGDTVKVSKDTAFKVDYSVTVDPKAKLSDTFAVHCWDRSLKFFENEKEITSASELIRQMQIRFYEQKIDMLYGYKEATVEIKTIAGPQTDKEIFQLTKGSGFFIHQFPMDYLPQGTVTVGDGRLQMVHETDSIVATFRNPKLPLDTLRYAIPFKLVVTLDSLRLHVYPNDTIFAGDTATTVATIYSSIGIIKNFKGTFTWGFVDLKGLNDSTTFKPLFDSSLFMPLKAPTTARVWTVARDTFNRVLTDTVLITVLVGPPRQICIEQSNDPAKFPFAPNLFPNNTITIYANETDKKAYAVLRDKVGNYVNASQATDWAMADTAVAVVAVGVATQGEGVVTRKTKGQTSVAARDRTYNLSGNAKVLIVDYYYTEIDIYVKTPAPVSIAQLLMNTNQDTILYVQGRRSDTKLWEDVAGCDWFVTPSLKTETPPPSNKQNWKVSPIDTGTGIITVVLNTLRDSVSARFIAGPPTKVELEFITPLLQRIAGKPIDTRITIRNDDNMLIPGSWTSESVFKELLPSVPVVKNLEGKVMVPGVVINNDFVAFNNTHPLTFFNGSDTVKTLLYWVPPAGQLHDIQIGLYDSVKQTMMTDHEKTILYPGPVARIRIEPHDTTTLKPGEGKQYKTIGWDEFANFIGDVPSNWITDQTLPRGQKDSSVVFYYGPQITVDVRGFLHAAATANHAARDSVYIIITGPQGSLVSALTRDVSGNGYLDGIKLVFNQPVQIPVGFDFTSLLVSYQWKNAMDVSQNTVFQVSDISPKLGTFSVEWLLTLAEVKTDVPQTAWTPSILFTKSKFPGTQTADTIRTSDGAGPVIWKVVKKVNDIYDPSKDAVTILISEDFQRNDGSDFNLYTPAPATVFTVWMQQAASGDTVTVPQAFRDIAGSRRDKQYVSFTMSNKFVLLSSHYVNIQYTCGYITDKAGNNPNLNNQKVRVMIEGGMGSIIIAPVPIIPSLNTHSLIKNQELQHIDPPKGFDLIKKNGGALITIDIVINLNKNGQIQTGGKYDAKAALMIYDAAGNLVHKRENKRNVIPVELWNGKINKMNDTTTIQTLAFYWDGISDRGMKSAPGIYKIYVFITYNNEKKQYSRIVAVGR
ncbi:MAG: VWA domain-containing protein [Chitinivibrionales bacterium]|nr:VWA domain-containing protein [Chitinivibrionales bacterium]